MEYAHIMRDAILTTILAVCAERVVNKLKKWWYRSEDININDIKINFVPETSEEEKVIITRKGHLPEVFKYCSDIE